MSQLSSLQHSVQCLTSQYSDHVTEQRQHFAWEYAIESKDEPTALVLTRQNLPQMAGSSKEALKGAYILEDSDKETPDGIIIASGSEVNLGCSCKGRA